MPDARDTQNDISVWCVGLPLESRRPLTPEECAELHHESRRDQWRGIAAIVLIPVMSFAFMLMGALTSLLSIPDELSGGVALIAGFILLPIAILKANDWFGARKLARRDLKAGTVSRFVGSIGLLIGPQVIEVLDGSDRLWRRNLSLVKQSTILPRTEAAATPDFAAIAAEWVQPLAPGQPDAPYVSDREMTGTEQTELNGIIRRLRWDRWVWLVAMNLLVVVILIGAADAGRGPDPNSVVFVVLLFGSTAYGDYRWLRRLQLASSLTRDLRVGRILIARMPLPPGSDETHAPALSAPEEFLPHSQALWTVDGLPAPWRRGTQMRRSRKPE